MKIILVNLLILLTLVGFSQQLPQKITDDNQIIKHNGYIISYNETHEQPNWVYYVLKPSDFTGESVNRRNVFKADGLVETGSASLDDYKGSGYDRGHLKPAGDEPTDREQMDETFYMSNMSPQEPSFNRGIWKTLENHVRKEVLTSDSVVVIVGGVLTGELKTIGENKVSVPRYFYKHITIYRGDTIERLMFVLPNKKSDMPLYTYRVDLDILEDFVKIKF